MFARIGYLGARLAGGLLGLVFLLAPPQAAAQVTLAQVEAQADRYHEQAMAMATSYRLSDLPRIVEVHAQSANLRHWKDPDAFTCLRLQGRLLHEVGKPAEARRYLEDAAGVALANGDEASAAEAFVEAAFAAEAAGNHAGSQVLLRKAYNLSQSSGVTAQERRLIQQRIRFPQR